MDRVSNAIRGHRAPANLSNNGHDGSATNGHSTNGRSHKTRFASPQQARGSLVERLRTRREHIEHEIFAAACASSDLSHAQDAEYAVGLRVAVAATVDFLLDGIELGEDRSDTIPSAVVAQAHRAARDAVDLGTVLLHYVAAQRVLVRFLIAAADDSVTTVFGQVLDLNALLVKHLMDEVSVEYKRELTRARCSPDQRHAELVRRLLSGELVDTAKLGYILDAWHIGVIATGFGAREALCAIAASADRQLLSVLVDEETVWAWLGGRHRLDVSDLEPLLSADNGPGVSLAIGEPGSGIDGLRLTHRQAQAARLVALHRPRRVTRHADDMLLAAALRDETLARSLRQTFLSPLARQRDGGAVSLQTLREYFAAGCNASKAGSQLGVNRHTVESRLGTAQQHIGRPLDTCLIELEVALRLDELDSAGDQLL